MIRFVEASVRALGKLFGEVFYIVIVFFTMDGTNTINPNPYENR